MNEYLTIAEQKNFLSLPFDTKQLKVLDKNAASKLQIVSFKGEKSIKSTQDIYRKLRIVISSLLIKIYTEYSQANADRLQRLKKIIYNAKLESLCEQKGIMREQLLKSVASQVKNLRVCSSVQIDIIKLFNNSPFFDEVILTSIREENPLVFESDCQLGCWIERQFSIKFIRNQQYTRESKEDDLSVIALGEYFHASKDCKSEECFYKSYQQYLIHSTQPVYSSKEQDLSEIYERISRNQLFSCPMSPCMRQEQPILELHPSLYTSVQSKSPSNYDFSVKENSHPNIRISPDIKLFQSQKKRGKKKSSQKVHQIAIRNSIDEKNKESNSPHRQKLVKKRSRNNNQEESMLWRFLCCSKF